ncbi:MAG: hypothetical protein RPR97_02925 [Colwellia sp.]
MFAINDDNKVVSIEEKATPATLVLVDNHPLPQGFLKMKAMLDTKRYETSHVYDSVLSSQERAALCFAAGLGLADCRKVFKEFNDDQKLSLHKAVLMMQNIFKAFNDVKAISPAKFLQSDIKTTTIKGVLS